MINLNKSNEITNDLENIINSLHMFHFSRELDYNKGLVEKFQNDSQNEDQSQTQMSVENNEIKNNCDVLRVEKIENIISALKNKSNNLAQIKDTKKDFFTKIDNAVFKQPWKRLSAFHKNIKIKEYIADSCSKIDCEPTKLKVLETLLLDNGSLTDKYVMYDQINSKIIDIPNLSFDKKKDIWNLNIDKKKPKKIIKK